MAHPSMTSIGIATNSGGHPIAAAASAANFLHCCGRASTGNGVASGKSLRRAYSAYLAYSVCSVCSPLRCSSLNTSAYSRALPMVALQPVAGRGPGGGIEVVEQPAGLLFPLALVFYVFENGVAKDPKKPPLVAPGYGLYDLGFDRGFFTLAFMPRPRPPRQL